MTLAKTKDCTIIWGSKLEVFKDTFQQTSGYIFDIFTNISRPLILSS